VNVKIKLKWNFELQDHKLDFIILLEFQNIIRLQRFSKATAKR
jgi:hypothetical protein